MVINKDYIKQIGIFLGFVLGFWLLSMWFFQPALDGMVIKQGDMQQVRMMTSSTDTIKAKTGTIPGWNDRLFSGMPSNLISGIESGNLLHKSRVVRLFGFVVHPFDMLFMAMLSMFIMLRVVRVNYLLSAAGSIAYAFMAFNISSIEAGHITKVNAMAMMPAVVAGLYSLSRGKLLQGAVLTTVFFSQLVSFFHYQIAYYMGVVVGVFVVVEVFKAFKEKSWKPFAIQTGVMVGSMLIALAPSTSKLYDTMVYSKQSMRGGSEVKSEQPKDGPNMVSKGGLDINYAFSWSYGISESFTLFVPRFKGGSSNEPMPDNQYGIEYLQGAYFGDMPFTSGPVYVGAVLLFLFVLSVVYAFWKQKNMPDDSQAKNFFYIAVFALATFLVSLFLAWGKNFSSLNNFLFETLPYYNKFRTPMMTLSIAQLIVPIFGIYGAYVLITDKLSDENIKKWIKTALISTGVILGVTLLVANNQTFNSPVDSRILAQEGGQSQLSAIKELRADIMWGDIWRTVIFVLFTLAIVYGAIKRQLNQNIASIGILILVVIDMFGVANRYISEENWQEKEQEYAILPSRLDEAILATNKDNARVYDLRRDPFNDNTPAPFHRNIGGYHPAKLSRYQDIISYCITKNGQAFKTEDIIYNNALDMLNCRYILAPARQKGQTDTYIPRETALGAAWYIDSVFEGGNSADVLAKINSINISNSVVVESAEGNKPGKLVYDVDSNAAVEMVKYNTDSITYSCNSTYDGLVAFSELYYKEKTGEWRVFIDGKPATPLRVNYILRAVEVPVGKHTVVWKYNRTDYSGLRTLEMGSSVIILGGLLLFVLLPLRQKREEE